MCPWLSLVSGGGQHKGDHVIKRGLGSGLSGELSQMKVWYDVCLFATLCLLNVGRCIQELYGQARCGVTCAPCNRLSLHLPLLLVAVVVAVCCYGR